MAETKKYYWLKLKRDFFKRHDIRIIEEMENGKDYILFYLKMLLESIDHEGELRFSETIPYNEKMLSVITNTNIDIVRCALKVFAELKMIEIFDDSTIYMAEVKKLTGSETEFAKKKREYRQKLLETKQNEDNVETKKDNVRQEIEKELEIEKDKEIDIIELDKPTKPSKPKQKQFIPPTLEEIQAYCIERKNNVDAKKFYDYFNASEWHDSKGNKVKSWKQKIITWENNGFNNKPQAPQSTTQQGSGNIFVDLMIERGEFMERVDDLYECE